jgi:hypothetical protein
MLDGLPEMAGFQESPPGFCTRRIRRTSAERLRPTIVTGAAWPAAPKADLTGGGQINKHVI